VTRFRHALLVAALLALGCSKLEHCSTGSSARPGPPTKAVACGAGQRLTVHFYDVGQALAALVDLPDGRHILVDTGDSPHRPGCGEECVTADWHLLDQLSIDLHGAPIDAIWITHQHSDHIGGAPYVMSRFRVKTYVDNGLRSRRREVRRARRVAREHGVQVRVVNPDHPECPIPSSPNLKITPILPPVFPPSCAHDPNECSIALRIDYCASSVLFMGDAEHDEEHLLDPRGPVTLLQVAHHGSDTSTTPSFLFRVKPKYAVISAGKPNEGLNRDYCHPRAAIVRRLSRVLGGASRMLEAFDGTRCDRAQASDWVTVPASDHLWATERDGDVVLTTTGDGVFTRH
jgi:competence protein ComEC